MKIKKIKVGIRGVKDVLEDFGRAEDVAQLDWKEIRSILPELQLPQEVRRLWEDYFEHSKK